MRINKRTAYCIIATCCFLLFSFLEVTESCAQGCCSGGSGSPIAGGASQGVLFDRQAEIGASFQHIQTHSFFTGDQKSTRLFDHYKSDYVYLRLAYGVTQKLTMSVETGYFFNKTQVGLNHSDTMRSSGIGDLIFFPRYNVYTKNTEKTRNEITIGLGYKIPLGKYNDSSLIYTNPLTGHKTYTTSPPTIQPTNGSQDIIFYGFLFRGYPSSQFRIFANVLYIKKGWNPLGQKFGDYSSVGLFASKTLFRKVGITLQLKAEKTGRMKYDKNVDMLALYNIDVSSTGNKKLAFVPQLSYSKKNLSVYVLSDIPLYQYVYGTQVGSALQVTIGGAYRFYIKPIN